MNADARTHTSAPCLRICLIYDCLYPYTIGGGERWYRNLAEQLAANGHDVTYVTLRQWDHDARGEISGVRVIAVGPRFSLYSLTGQRRILPPIVFGAGVLLHLLLRGRRYDVIHTSSFPFFSLLAVAFLQPVFRWRVIVDWLEFWSREYWKQYLGEIGGRIGWAVQWLCLKIPQRAFCLAPLTARRLKQHRINGPIQVLRGLYCGAPVASEPRNAKPFVVSASRLVPEKRVRLIPSAVATARMYLPQLRAVILGDGPERQALLADIAELGLSDVIDVPGVVDRAVVEDLLKDALCVLHPSSREGYGLIVVEAAAAGTPAVLVHGEDNAAVDLVEEGLNGFVVESPESALLAAAIVRIHAAGPPMRAATMAWFKYNSRTLSLDASLTDVVSAYRSFADIPPAH